MRRKKISRGTPIGADPAQQEIPVRIKHTDVARQIVPDRSMNKRLLADYPPQAGHINQSLAIDENIRRALHVRPLIKILTVGAEKLDAIVLSIGDQYPAIVGDAYPMGEIELSRAGAGFPPGLDQITVCREAVDTRIPISVTDVKIAVGCNGNICGAVKRGTPVGNTG